MPGAHVDTNSIEPLVAEEGLADYVLGFAPAAGVSGATGSAPTAHSPFAPAMSLRRNSQNATAPSTRM